SLVVDGVHAGPARGGDRTQARTPGSRAAECSAVAHNGDGGLLIQVGFGTFPCRFQWSSPRGHAGPRAAINTLHPCFNPVETNMLDSRRSTILITGATGNVGTELSRQLSAQKVPFRAMVRSRKGTDALAALEGAELVVGDFDDEASLASALKDV